MITYYRAMVICPVCKHTYKMETADKNLIKNPFRCFGCSKKNKTIDNQSLEEAGY